MKALQTAVSSGAKLKMVPLTDLADAYQTKLSDIRRQLHDIE